MSKSILNTYNAINNPLFPREIYLLHNRVGLRERNDWSIQNRGLHSTAHHSVTKKGSDTIITIVGVGVTEILLKSVPIHRIIGLEKPKVWEEPRSIVSF